MTGLAKSPRSTLAVRAAAWAACVLVGLSACGGPEQSPQDRIKSLIDRAEQAAEARDISVFKEDVSGEYRDRRGYDRRTVLRIIQGIFLRNQQIHLFSVVRDLEVHGDTASARVMVAMAGRPIESAESLLDTRARLMRFDVDFTLEDGEWRVRAVTWEPAKVGEFL